MSHTTLDVAVFGGERRKTVARSLGAEAVKLNQFDNQPGQAGREHDESESGQEEIYTALQGSGVIRVDGEELPLRPGLYVLVSPDATRQVVAGDQGLGYLVVGAVAPGRGTENGGPT
jgi:quercetin dioxygenase-like cupin family protein